MSPQLGLALNALKSSLITGSTCSRTCDPAKMHLNRRATVLDLMAHQLCERPKTTRSSRWAMTDKNKVSRDHK
jgi:hypothetical protein